ncbi:hypothetical protein [Bowmanella denitrificans]|uniref:hypothetical protein n=1 Tax=Bowmanella denitrificans TaxID=366582 RepID=UPI000C9A11C8|nr:hypothetical protein [Bowmanella denitrificans]
MPPANAIEWIIDAAPAVLDRDQYQPKLVVNSTIPAFNQCRWTLVDSTGNKCGYITMRAYQDKPWRVIAFSAGLPLIKNLRQDATEAALVKLGLTWVPGYNYYFPPFHP